MLCYKSVCCYMFQDDTYVNGVRSDVDGTEHCHSETVQVLTAAGGRETHKNEGMQQQDVFTSVKVECVLQVSFIIVKYHFIVKNSISNEICFTKNGVTVHCISHVLICMLCKGGTVLFPVLYHGCNPEHPEMSNLLHTHADTYSNHGRLNIVHVQWYNNMIMHILINKFLFNFISKFNI